MRVRKDVNARHKGGHDGAGTVARRMHDSLSLFGIRRVRLITGLVLFVYIFSHLLNHALGLVSLAAAERMLFVAKDVWYSLPGTIVLYGAAATHVALALRTLYTRQ